MDYNVKENYKGNNEKVLAVIEIWESMSYSEKLELFDELSYWNHEGV